MKKNFIIFIFFILLLSFNKSDDINFDFDSFLLNLSDIIRSQSTAQKVVDKIQERWDSISYIEKNIIYQNIDIIKNNCIKILKWPKKCKMIFDILGIL